MKINSCIICTQPAEKGYPPKLPKTFTAYQYLQAGDGICPKCHHMLTNPRFRRNSWCMTRDGVTHLLKDPLAKLLNPPKPPFWIYLTKAKRKHGWIRIIDKPALNRDRFQIAFEEQLVLVNREYLAQSVKNVRDLRQLKIPKAELLSGQLSPRSMSRLLDHAQSIMSILQHLKGDPLWEIAVKFSS